MIYGRFLNSGVLGSLGTCTCINPRHVRHVWHWRPQDPPVAGFADPELNRFRV